jgi:hypothetical protein
MDGILINHSTILMVRIIEVYIVTTVIHVYSIWYILGV